MTPARVIGVEYTVGFPGTVNHPRYSILGMSYCKKSLGIILVVCVVFIVTFQVWDPARFSRISGLRLHKQPISQTVATDACAVPPGSLTFVIAVTYYRKCCATLRNISCFLRRQTYPHWHLFLTGDCFEPFADVIQALKDLPPCRVHLHNLESPGERGRPGMTGSALWATAGTTAGNNVLTRAEAFFNGSSALLNDSVVISHLDDDDYWEPYHLQTLADRYALYPSARFVYTRARGCHRAEGFPGFETDGLNNLPPTPAMIIHSSASWKMNEFRGFRYQQRAEMAHVQAGDADMWARMTRHMQTNKKDYSFVPKATLIHGGEDGGKDCVPIPDACAP